MSFQRIKPSPPLDQWIQSYWIVERNYCAPHAFQAIYPDGDLDLIIDLNDDNANSMFNGQQTRRLHLPQQGKVKFLAVQFYAFGAFPFLSVPVHELTDQLCTPEDLFGSGFNLLRERILAQPDGGFLPLLEEFLLQRLFRVNQDVEVVKSATELLFQTRGNLRTQELADQVNLSRRSLERKFEAVAGLSPKALARVIRFRGVKRELIQNRNLNLTSLAHAYQFFDQAHFNHDFRQITGMTPSEFARDFRASVHN
ncbi:MAG: AraC family transcriptional regulator [Bacteroidia bacterium]|nr:AraC family transcriptional regulator [Bacteroidia bacterium]